MADEAKTPDKQTPAQERKAVIQAYHDAKTPADKAAVVKANPWLAEIFSSINHTVGILLLLYLFAASSLAGWVTIGGNPFVFTGTTNTTGVTLSSTIAAVPSQSVSVQTLTGYTSTNDTPMVGQISLDNSNFVTVTSLFYPGTNAQTYLWNTAPTNIPIYGRILIYGTNSSRSNYIQINN